MELTTEQIIKINKTYKQNIKSLASKKGMNLVDLSSALGMKRNYISNVCNKKDLIINNNILHRISIILGCTITELVDGM